MKIIEEPSRLVFESRLISSRTWLAWGLLFLPGLLGLGLLPEASRFIGLVIWMALWLASIFVLPRWVGDLIQVTVDSQARRITWARNGAITREIKYGEIKSLESKQLSTTARPYRAFQLIAILRSGSQVTLAVDPRQATIEGGLEKARKFFR